MSNVMMNNEINFEIAKMHANEMMKQYNFIDCFVIIENMNKKYVYDVYTNLHFNVEFDIVYFSCYDEMKKFIEKKCAYDYIDNSCKLHDNEKIVYVYSKSKLCFM